MPTKKKTAKKKADVRGKARKKPAARRTSAPAPKGALRLRTVSPSLTVNDVDKSLSWYRDVLGFTVKERWEDDGKLLGVELAAGDASFYINQDDWKKGRDRVKGDGFRLYCSTSQDIDRLAEQIKARGGLLVQEPHDQMGARALTVADPDGFKITISKG